MVNLMFHNHKPYDAISYKIIAHENLTTSGLNPTISKLVQNQTHVRYVGHESTKYLALWIHARNGYDSLQHMFCNILGVQLLLPFNAAKGPLSVRRYEQILLLSIGIFCCFLFVENNFFCCFLAFFLQMQYTSTFSSSMTCMLFANDIGSNNGMIRMIILYRHCKQEYITRKEINCWHVIPT